MESKNLLKEEKVNPIFEEIRDLVNRSRERVYSTVNTEMLNLYWNIGKIIMEIQQGDERASYGNAVLEKLSEKLTNEFGKGFSSRNLRTMRKFYLMYPIWKTVSAKLSWSHYLELIKIEEESKRSFYQKEAINARWSVRELQRQKAALLYERLVLSKERSGFRISQRGANFERRKGLSKRSFRIGISGNERKHELFGNRFRKEHISTFEGIFARIRKRIYVCWKLSKDYVGRRPFLSRLGIL